MKNYSRIRKNIEGCLLAGLALLMVVACGGKKKSDDIITKRVETVFSQEPIRMQDYTDKREVLWLGKKYHVTIHRQAADSLTKVKDENGQVFVDNIFSMAVTRDDGSIFFSRTFTKSQLVNYLDDDYRKTGIFEGLVFDRVEDDQLFFAASVGHPQTDEYIPLVICLSKTGDLQMTRDTQMDTSAQQEEEEI